MCVIAMHGAKNRIDRKTWDQMWEENPHGGGIAYIIGGRIETKHSLNRDSLWSDYQKAMRDHPEEMMTHFRIATHGSISLPNCHPFRVRNGVVIAHNGIVSQLVQETKDDESDTRALVRIVLRNLPSRFPDNPGMNELVADYLGYDKLGMLNLFTEERAIRYGTWTTDKATGIHFSNTWWRMTGTAYRSAQTLPAPTVATNGREHYPWCQCGACAGGEGASAVNAALDKPLPALCLEGKCYHLDHRFSGLCTTCGLDAEEDCDCVGMPARPASVRVDPEGGNW